MLIRKFFYLPFFISIIFYGCAGSYAPKNWLPETEKVQEESYGGWLTILSDTTEPNIKKQRIICAGEFIGLDSGSVYILADSIIIIKKNNIEKCELELDKKSHWFIGWSILGSLSTLTHGWYLVISFPIWVATGIFFSLDEDHRDHYEAELPPEQFWVYIQKFARFPQGISGEINLKELKPKIVKAD